MPIKFIKNLVDPMMRDLNRDHAREFGLRNATTRDVENALEMANQGMSHDAIQKAIKSYKKA